MDAERYGTHLTSDELQQFDALKDDYEVNWHINQLRSAMTPSSEEVRSRSITVKNRRRAYMSKLISDGEYFSEDAMREREPYLHHEYLGRFQDPFGRSMARPGEKWSETLMRRSDEAFLVAEIRREQQRLGVAERDWVGNEINRQQEEETGEEEEETEDEEEEEEEDADDEHEEEEGSSVRQVWEISDSSAAADVSNLFPLTYNVLFGDGEYMFLWHSIDRAKNDDQSRNPRPLHAFANFDFVDEKGSWLLDIRTCCYGDINLSSVIFNRIFSCIKLSSIDITVLLVSFTT